MTATWRATRGTDATDERVANVEPPYVPILLYHRVANDAPPSLAPFTIAPSLFDDHMAYLADHGYQTLSIEQLVATTHGEPAARRPLPARPVVVTFDDGFADFAAAWTIIRHHGHTATLYMVSGYAGGTSDWLVDRVPMLTWREIVDLAADGCEIGAHTEHHRPLDVVHADVAADEIRHSKEAIEDQLQRTVDTFAYPFGHHNRVSRALAIAAGFKTACAVKNRLSALPDDRYALARVTIGASTDAAALGHLLDASTVGVVAPGERWRTRGYRWWRRARCRLAHDQQNVEMPAITSRGGTDVVH